ncbi:hypothetical protein H4217_002043 [Coemansia sp. RSA 1939]|nr:hypothetical protein H4217_002043 [Coemansia sp. RSA 1939]KAJ2675673.1 hypothetical protein GGH99_005905 [Coemansia sp. RSA 1285]
MNQYGTQTGTVGPGGLGAPVPQDPTYQQYPPMSHNQQGFHASYAAGSGGIGQPVPPAPMPPQQSFGPPPSVAPPPSRPPAGYTPTIMPDRPNTGPGRLSRPPTSVSRRRSDSQNNNNHYGHLVSEDPLGDIPCSGAACSACCKYNTIGCILCCNGWLRLCGGGTSIKDILGMK